MKAGHTRTQRIILVVGLAVLCAYLASGLVRRMAHARQAEEFAGARSSYGTATVVSVVRETASNPEDIGRAWALVRFRGRLYTARTAIEPAQLEPGMKARIVYRTGKTGSIAVDRVEPLAIQPSGSTR